MTGKYQIEINNKHTKYFLKIKRNITILQGNSASGKSELIRMLTAYENNGASSGINVKSSVPVHVVSGPNWELLINSFQKSIIFFDENASFVKSKDFARVIQKNDNYFVIINRDPLKELSYSIEEIYGFRQNRDKQKYHTTYRVYNEMYSLYNLKANKEILPKTIITEDSNSGYQFFNNIFSDKCIAAGGKSRIIESLSKTSGNDVLEIVDGAAFGSEIAKLIEYTNENNIDCVIYAPESFEYLLLKAGFVDIPADILDNTYDYADSLKYISWEDFYTRMLIEKTNGTPYQYSKTNLNKVYLSESAVSNVKRIMPEFIK